MQLAQLFRVHRGGRPSHEIGGIRGLRERDYLANRGLAAEDRDHTVEPEGDAPVRRRAVFERLQEEAEPRPRLLLRNAEPAKDPRLQRRVVNTDAAAADLRSVQHEIVRLCAY